MEQRRLQRLQRLQWWRKTGTLRRTSRVSAVVRCRLLSRSLEITCPESLLRVSDRSTSTVMQSSFFQYRFAHGELQKHEISEAITYHRLLTAGFWPRSTNVFSLRGEAWSNMMKSYWAPSGGSESPQTLRQANKPLSASPSIQRAFRHDQVHHLRQIARPGRFGQCWLESVRRHVQHV